MITNSLSFPVPCSTTTGEGGKNGEGKPCTFPFLYNGKMKDSCTTEDDPDGRHWCATKVDPDTKKLTKGGNWGFCKDSCLRYN